MCQPCPLYDYSEPGRDCMRKSCAFPYTPTPDGAECSDLSPAGTGVIVSAAITGSGMLAYGIFRWYRTIQAPASYRPL
jgi:hypothetical protein